MSEAELLWKLLSVLALAAGFGVAVKKIFFGPRLPVPLETREVERFMTARECQASHSVFEARLCAVERRLDSHLQEVKHDISALHEKINEGVKESAAQHAEVMRAIGRLEGP